MCGRRADDVRTTYVIRHLKSPTKSHSRVVRTSSARRPHVVCTSSARRTHETSVPRLFQVKQQRTALLKKKAFQWKANHPLANRCMGYIVNKFEQVMLGEGSQVNKIEQVRGEGVPNGHMGPPQWTDGHG